MSSLWLLRHGETAWSREGRFCGHRDEALTPGGRAQGRAVGEALAGSAFEAIWTSDLRRTIETARLALAAMGSEAVATPDARLRELDFGEMEGLRWDNLDAERREALLAFDTFAAPGGGSVAAMRERVRAFVRGLGTGRHLVVTHGGVIRVLLRELGEDAHVPPGGLAVLEPGAAPRLVLVSEPA